MRISGDFDDPGYMPHAIVKFNGKEISGIVADDEKNYVQVVMRRNKKIITDNNGRMITECLYGNVEIDFPEEYKPLMNELAQKGLKYKDIIKSVEVIR